MSTHGRPARVLILALILPGALPAQDPLHFGAQVSAFSLQGSSKDAYPSGLGNDVGFHLGIPFLGGNEIQPRLSLRTPPSRLPGSSNPRYGTCLGLDYLYYPSGRASGLYFKAGAEAFRWSSPGASGASSSSPGAVTTLTDTSGVQPMVGAGFRFNRWIALEGGVVWSHFDRTAGGRAGATLLQFGVSIH